MQQIQKYYPMQGSRRYETTNFPCVKTFRLTCTGMTSNKTSTYQSFERGCVVLGFQAVVNTVFAVTGLLRLGFTGQLCYSTLTGFPTTDLTTLGNAFGPSATGIGCSYTITAVSDTFDGLSNTKTLTSGKLDIHVLYVPPPNGEADSTTFKTYYAT
jgi:hypothetical protein